MVDGAAACVSDTAVVRPNIRSCTVSVAVRTLPVAFLPKGITCIVPFPLPDMESAEKPNPSMLAIHDPGLWMLMTDDSVPSHCQLRETGLAYSVSAAVRCVRYRTLSPILTPPSILSEPVFALIGVTYTYPPDEPEGGLTAKWPSTNVLSQDHVPLLSTIALLVAVLPASHIRTGGFILVILLPLPPPPPLPAAWKRLTYRLSVPSVTTSSALRAVVAVFAPSG